MERSILLTCTGLLLAACSSGADVAESGASPDSAAVETLEGIPPLAESQPKNARP